MTRIASYFLVCAAVLLAGCRFEGAVDVAVEADGSGTLAYVVTADRALLATAADAGVDPLARLEQTAAQFDDWEVSRSATADGGATVTLSTAFADAAELERISGDVAGALEAPELAPLGPLRLTVADDTMTLDGGAGLAVTRQVRELGLTRSQAHARLAEAAGLRVEARMPGRILETNADARPDDTTAVWNIVAGERRVLQVDAERPWSLQRVLALVGGPYAGGAIVFGLLVALVGLIAWRRRRRRVAAPDQPAADHPADDEPADDGPADDGPAAGGGGAARRQRAGAGGRERPAHSGAAEIAAARPTGGAAGRPGSGAAGGPGSGAGDRDGAARSSRDAAVRTDHDGWLPVVRAGHASDASGAGDAGDAGAVGGAGDAASGADDGDDAGAGGGGGDAGSGGGDGGDVGAGDGQTSSVREDAAGRRDDSEAVAVSHGGAADEDGGARGDDEDGGARGRARHRSDVGAADDGAVDDGVMDDGGDGRADAPL
ncbi:MAG TPA: hypothetical protein VK891_03590 [Euzebyales bacterium]|nr:hypothetical protein [Euzebyales bacterium]